MMYRVIALLLFLLLGSPVRGFLPHIRTFVQGTRFSRPLLHRLSMSSRTLAKVQEKLCGREDLPLMLELEDEDDLALLRDLESLVVDNEVPPEPEIGQQVTGLVISVDESAALLAINGKMSGIIPVAEAGLLPVKHLPELMKVGDSVTAEMIGTLHGMPVISMRTTQLLQAWKNVTETKAAEVTFPVVVMEVNKGGAVCTAFGGLKAFLPGSHCVGTADQSLIGSSVMVKILDAVPETGKLVVSQRLAQSAAAPSLQRGSLVAATVTGLRPYGAFLELEGGHSGLLHISQVSSERVESLAALFAVGDKLRAVVLDHDRATGKVALGTKQLEGQPGDILRDKQAVFERAEETLKKYNERVAAERAEREAAVQAVVAGLTAPLEVAPAVADTAQGASGLPVQADGGMAVPAGKGRGRPKRDQGKRGTGTGAGAGEEAVEPDRAAAPAAAGRPVGQSKAAKGSSGAKRGGQEISSATSTEGSTEGSTERKPRGRPAAKAVAASEGMTSETPGTSGTSASARTRSLSTSLSGADPAGKAKAGRGLGAKRVAGPGRRWKGGAADAGTETASAAAEEGEEVPSIDSILAAILAGTPDSRPSPSEAS